jgi:hypothetical protein
VYKDTAQHYYPAIEIHDAERGVVSMHIHFKHIWDHASPGDTLTKRANSLEYRLGKSDTTLYFYPHCVEAHEVGAVENPHFKEDLRRLQEAREARDW